MLEIGRAVPIVAIALAGCHHGTIAVHDTIEETRPLAADGTLDIGNTNGRIEIEAWDREEVWIEAERGAPSQRMLERIEVEIRGEGDRIEVRTHLPHGFLWGGAGQVEYRVKAPRGAALRIESVNGPVRVLGADGDVRATTVNGSLEIEGAPDEVEASTVNGRIEASYESSAADGRHHFSTTNGSVTIHLPPDVAGSFRASTVNGGIDCDLPIPVEGKWNKQLDGRVGEGGGTYEVETVNGAVKIRQS
jgi:hypothetical protein